MSIQLSDSAAQRVRQFMQQKQAQGLRFGVKRSGCSGWAYAVEMADEKRREDHEFEHAGIPIYVDSDSLPLVDGTRIDFVAQGINRIFVFDNPNVQDECGCGESFTVTEGVSEATAR